MPSTFVAFMIASAPISTARSAPAVSVVKKGFPVPAAKMTTRPFSRCRMARRRMYGSARSEEHTSELQSHSDLVCRLLLDKKTEGERGEPGESPPVRRVERVFDRPNGLLEHVPEREQQDSGGGRAEEGLEAPGHIVHPPAR